MKIKVNNVNDANMKEINVRSNLPASLYKLEEIAQNIWWTWDSNAKNLFRQIDKDAWIEASSNPVLLLNILNYDKLVSLGKDKEFIKKVDIVYDEFKAYLNVEKNTKAPSLAYFSMEYGLTEVLKIYSGGLGVLAGDYLKEASDCNIVISPNHFQLMVSKLQSMKHKTSIICQLLKLKTKMENRYL